MDELPRRYAGVDVPHWEQYTGWWAIHPLRFQQFAAFCGGLNPQAHLSAGRIARRGEEEDAAPYTVHDGVALLEIVGPMTKYGSSFAPLGAMLQTRRNLRAALADPKVRAAVLRIDSPGGTTTGTDDLAAEVLTANQKKPIVAYGEDLMASAAYYVASQAEEIVATKATEIGSIGVFTVVDVAVAGPTGLGRVLGTVTIGPHLVGAVGLTAATVGAVTLTPLPAGQTDID